MKITIIILAIVTIFLGILTLFKFGNFAADKEGIGWLGGTVLVGSGLIMFAAALSRRNS